MVTTGALGSKPNAQTSALLFPAGVILLILTFLPFVYIIPYYINMILQATIIIFIGAHLSIPGTQINQETGETEDKPPLEQMSRKDVMKFPIYGSCVLFGLYCLFKFQKELANLLLGLYFTGLGVIALAGLISPMIAPAFGRSAFWNKQHEHDVPVIGELAFNMIDVVCLFVCAPVGYIYYTTHLWWCNNLFGVSFSIRGIEMLSLGSFLNGAILLSGLFIYDVFWVFGTDVMVTVAKSFQAPIKLVFPRDWNEPKEKQFSMLGLGDIVIPGLFIALMLRWDVVQCAQKGEQLSEGKKKYFYAQMLGYVTGLVTTVVMMIQFKAAQPALLYLVPAALLSAFLTAAIRGQISQLIAYQEEEAEEEGADAPKTDSETKKTK